MNLARLGDESVERFGEYTALHFEGRDLTNVDQHRTAARVAAALSRMDVGPGDRVVVLLPNCPEVLAAYTGILGAPHPRGLRGEGGDHRAGAGGESRGLGRTHHSRRGHWDEWLAHESDVFATVERADGDLAVILYTSGTTGRPKGVALSHANLISNARAAASRYELDRERWNLGVLPLSHPYGLVTLNAGNILGTKSVLLRWFNAEAVLDAIARYG